MSKTAFVLYTFIIVLLIVITPIVGLLVGKPLGVLALGWIIAGILAGILMGCFSEKDYKLVDDFQWRFSVIKPEPKPEPDKKQEEGVKL